MAPYGPGAVAAHDVDGVMQSPGAPSATRAGAVILTYERAGELQVGSVALDQP
jgi:hypothetical protein